MTPRRFLAGFAIVVLVALVAGACGAADDQAGTPTSPAPTSGTPSTAPAGTAPGTSVSPTEPTTPGRDTTPDLEVPDVSKAFEPPGTLTGGTVGLSYPLGTHPPELSGIIGQAVADLSERLGIDETAVTVVLVEEVTWGDTSLGCPQPDMLYPQVVTDGMRILLEAGGSLYDYRADGVRDPFLCVLAPVTEKNWGGIFELREDGTVVTIAPPAEKGGDPTEGINPPDD